MVTSTIGSGWLFAPFFAARIAGVAALAAWLLGGLLAFLLALVFAELGSLVSSSGALAQIPLLSHGRTAGFIGGWCAWIAYLALPSVEVLAVLQYLASSLPWLTADGGSGQVLSPAGLAVGIALLLVLTLINLSGVKQLARWIDGLTSWKLAVPLLVSLALMLASGHWQNLQPAATASPSGPAAARAVVQALSGGGILFSLLGFRTAMDLAGEARQPQRTVPRAMALGLGISLAIYLLLQLAFLVSVPPAALQGGWSQLTLTAHGGPLVALSLGAGLGWAARLLLLDAAISPTATAMAYLGAASRVGWMMGRCGLLPAPLAALNRQQVPAPALLVSLAIGVLLLLGGPSWQGAVSFLTATLVIALAMGPVSLLALRRQWPAAERGYRLPLARLSCPAAFLLATWAIAWCGPIALRGAVLCVLLPALGFLLMERMGPAAPGQARQGGSASLRPPLDLRQGLWWFLYLGGIVAISGAALPFAVELAALSGWALLLFPLAVGSRLARPSPWAGVSDGGSGGGNGGAVA